MKKKIFLSYSSVKESDAAVVQEYFERNGVNVIVDTKERNSFWEYMNQIEKCNCVIALLNSDFFESPLCTYEIIKSYKCNKKIYPIWLKDLYEPNEEKRKNIYERLKKANININETLKKEYDTNMASFENYNEMILRLSNEVRYPRIGGTINEACNEIYKEIYNKPAKITTMEDEIKIRGSYLHDLDYVDEMFLRKDFIWFLGDLKRSSSFITSLFAEDVPGEQEWKFKWYTLRKGCIGVSLYIYAMDMAGNEQIIDIHDICGVEYNKNNGTKFAKYHIVVVDRESYKECSRKINIKQDETMENERCTKVFESCDKMRHRIILQFNDGNSFDNMSIIEGK